MARAAGARGADRLPWWLGGIAILVAGAVGGTVAWAAVATTDAAASFATLGPDEEAPLPFYEGESLVVGGGELPPVAPRAVGVVDGSTDGLYYLPSGQLCDVERLETYLIERPERALAWSAVFGTTPDGIGAVLDELRPVALRNPTQVRVVGFDPERATTAESEQQLEPGTIVLIDDRYVPRVRCTSGMPLLEPGPEVEQCVERAESGCDDAVVIGPAPVGAELTVFEVETQSDLTLPSGFRAASAATTTTSSTTTTSTRPSTTVARPTPSTAPASSTTTLPALPVPEPTAAPVPTPTSAPIPEPTAAPAPPATAAPAPPDPQPAVDAGPGPTLGGGADGPSLGP
jgi:Domain of unknown function (DUF6777)